MRTFLAILAVSMIAGTAFAGVGYACDPEVDTGPTPVGHYYVDAGDCDPTSCGVSIWIYEAGPDGEPCSGDETVIF